MIVVLWVHSNRFANLRLGDRQQRRLERSFPADVFIRCESKEQFLEALPRSDVACSFTFKAEWFARAPRLRRLISPAAGREGFPAELPDGVRVEFSTFHGRIMAETVVGMMLSHARGFLRAYSLQQEEPWPNRILEPSLKLLRGARVAVLGFGHIGGHVGRLAKCFGAVVTGLRRNPGETPDYFEEEDRLLRAEDLDQVLPQTDHLVLCLPATPETTGMVNARRLALLPESAGIYNVGRGNVIDESALAGLLRERPLCEAFLDVFQEEPLPAESPLRILPNCLVLPHASAIAPEFVDFFVEELIERLGRQPDEPLAETPFTE